MSKARLIRWSLPLGVQLMCVGAVLADATKPHAHPAADAEITALIRDLGDISYQTRTEAARRLCTIGMPARRQLESAAESDNPEIALRARRLLAMLDRLLFAGVDVVLAFSKPAIAWNEAVDLRITLTNRSEHPARVPFEIDPARQAALAEDARQVGDMLDVSEWLQVQSGDGREIELRVDDILVDSAVAAAVNRRLNGEPVSLIEAGEEVTIAARAFNRGWARYPLLDGGQYTALLAYFPRWEDEVLRAERVWHVTSNRATITVTGSAPEAVSRRADEAALSVARDGAMLVALLTNRADQPVFVNKNLGSAAPFAEGHWVYSFQGLIREVPVVPKPRASWHNFDESLLVEVAPGESTEIARIDIGDLRKAFSVAGAAIDGDRWTVHFTYSNLCDRHWQNRQGAALVGNPDTPKIFRTPLPRRTLSTRLSGNRLVAPKRAGRPGG